MAAFVWSRWLLICLTMFSALSAGTYCIDIYHDWVVAFDHNLQPLGSSQPEARGDYNLDDPVLRSTVQVYPHGWTAVYVFLDNPGMWNLRSQILRNWYLGQELYIRVFDSDPNPAKERPPPNNLLLCGIFGAAQSPFALPIYAPPPHAAEAPAPRAAEAPPPRAAEAPWFPYTPIAPVPESIWW